MTVRYGFAQRLPRTCLGCGSEGFGERIEERGRGHGAEGEHAGRWCVDEGSAVEDATA